MEKIIAEARELPLGDELEHIFKFQQEIDYVNSSVYNRKLTKKIAHDTLMALNETYGIYTELYNTLLKPGPPAVNKESYIQGFNLSTAKTLHSLIRVVTSINIGREDIFNYYDTLLGELKLHDVYFFPESLMQTSMLYGRYNNIMDRLYNNPDINLRPIVRWKETPDSFMKGGTIVNETYYQLLINFFWQFQYNMFMAIKKLPNDIEGNFDKAQEHFMEVWLHFFKILDFLGHDADSVGRIYSVYYHIKNQTPK